MRNQIIKGVVAVALLTMLSAFTTTKAQSASDLKMSIRLDPSTTTPGGTVGIFSFVTNTTTSRLRTTVSISSLSPCGITTVIGTNRLDLNPGQTVQVTVSYPIAPNACLGMYEVSIGSKSGSTGGKRSSGTGATVGATASLMVQ